jgi:dihydrolipoamide dehydrogenase
MDKFDLIVIGSGAGMHIVSNAVEEGMRLALVEQGPLGGTCLNNGCIPSKMLIYPADVIRAIQGAKSVGVEASITGIDFQLIIKRTRSVVESGRKELERSVKAEENVTLYRSSAEFIDNYTLKSGDKILTAPKIVLVSGARVHIPPIPGLREAGYLDNSSLLNINEIPKSIVIIGAGYIGCEYGHFLSAMGSDVTILGRSPQVLNNEDPEVCRMVKKVLSGDLKLLIRHEVINVEVRNGKKIAFARNLDDNKVYEFQADEILVAAGRISNSDILNPEKTGVKTDKQGWIKVNDYLETSKPGIWAFGDAIGKHMFRHTANYEAELVWHNIVNTQKDKVDFHAVPHAVFTHPTVASVGLKESDAVAAGYKVLIGRARYTEVAKGVAMDEENGFVKVVLEEETGKILGCAVVGSEAPDLVQQVVYLMNAEYQDTEPLIKSQVIHPTISEVIARAFANLEHPQHFAEGRDTA